MVPLLSPHRILIKIPTKSTVSLYTISQMTILSPYNLNTEVLIRLLTHLYLVHIGVDTKFAYKSVASASDVYREPYARDDPSQRSAPGFASASKTSRMDDTADLVYNMNSKLR
jgi:hypothetical protein